MRISVNTETEEIEELRHTVAIIEDAIKRRENPDLYEEESEKKTETKEYKKEPEQEKKVELKEPPKEVPQQEKLAVEEPKMNLEKPKVEEPTAQFELRIPQPMSYIQVQQSHQTQRPAPMPSSMEERGTAQAIDISALSMSSYGEAKEGRKMGSLTSSPSASSSSSMSSYPSASSSSNRLEPRGFEPRVNNNESAVKDIITSLRNQRADQSIQMSDIVSRARSRNISEQETRSLVSKLQRSGSI